MELQPDQLSKGVPRELSCRTLAFASTEIRCPAPRNIFGRLPHDRLVREHLGGIRQLVLGWGVDELDRQFLDILAPRVAKVDRCACCSDVQDRGHEVILQDIYQYAQLTVCIM